MRTIKLRILLRNCKSFSCQKYTLKPTNLACEIKPTIIINTNYYKIL